MSDKVTLNIITSLTGNETSAISKLNQNFQRLQEAIDDSLSRTGLDPSEMESDLDMNSNNILNAGTIYADAVVVDSGSITAVVGDLVELTSIAALRGYNTPDLPDASVVAVKAWYAGASVGGGHFMYRSNNNDADDGGFNIVDALGRTWRRQNTYEVRPEMFGAKGNGSFDDTEYFNDALDYCARNGIDFKSNLDYVFTGYMECYPRLNNFDIYLDGNYTWSSGTTYGGIFIEPIAGGTRPDIFSTGTFVSEDDNIHTCLSYDNWKNINDTNIDNAGYAVDGTDGGLLTIRGFNIEGSDGVTVNGWKRGIVTNCCPNVCIEGNRISGRKGGEEEVPGIPTSTTGLSDRGIQVMYRDYIERVITDVSVNPSTGVTTVTWSTGTAWDPRSGYVFIDNLDDDLGLALNRRTFKVENINSGSNTFVLKGLDGRDLPEYTSGGTFEGSPSGATCLIKHNKIQWYGVCVHLAGSEGYYVEDNRVIGGYTGLMVEEQLSLEFVGYNHFNCTARPVYVRGVGGVYGDSPVLIFGRREGCFIAGLDITSVGATTVGEWTTGSTLPWQIQDGKWVTFSTSSNENNVADITIGVNPTLTYTGADTFTNGDEVILTDLTGEWASLLNGSGVATATVGSVNTSTNTFVLLGFDSSSMTETYLDSLEQDDEGNVEYSTVSNGMIEITEESYEITDIDRSARTFRIVDKLTGDDIDSSTWNTWVDGKMHLVVEPLLLESCKGVNLSGWKATGQRATKIRGFTLKNCKTDVGSSIEAMTINKGAYAVIELQGTTDYFNIGEQKPEHNGADVIVWDTSDGFHTLYKNRRQLLDQTFTSATSALNARGQTEVAHPPVNSLRFDYAGTLAVDASANMGPYVTSGVMNVTDPTNADSGLLILSPSDLGPVVNNAFLFHDRMPRLVMPGAHFDMHYDSDDLFWRSLSTDKFEDVFQHFTDFYTITGTETGASGTSAAVSVSTYQAGTITRRPMGMAQLATGTTNTGSVHVGPLTNGWRLGQGSMLGVARVAIETLATDATEDYVVKIGFHNHYAGSSLSKGVYWQYDVGDNTKWTANTYNSGSTAQVVSAKTVGTADYLYFGVFVNGDASRADFFYWEDPADITVLTPLTTHIPSGASTVGFGVNVTKTAGTTSRNVHVDSLGFTVVNRRGAT